MNTDEQTEICKRQGGGLHSPLRRACVERGGQPLETFGDHLGVPPNADEEVLGHLEECTGYNGSLVNLLQPRAQGVHGAAHQPRKHHGPCFRPDGAEVVARVQKPLEQHAVGYQRSEEHTSELQSQSNLVCRLLLEKKKVPATNATQLNDANAS